jgi:16S rRNA (guanine966-N2)-methyltransferase
MSRVIRNRTSQNAPGANRLRIVGGRWRGMRIDFPAIGAIRPTPDRVRETLFNWLQTRIVEARCLDLFAGSGALGFEALSRGASHVTLVDREPEIARHLGATLARFHATNAEVHTSDALRFLERPSQRFDIVFLDPPFASEVLPAICESLNRGWLNPSASIYIECSSRSALPQLPMDWVIYRSKSAGEVGYHLLRAQGQMAEKLS